MVGVASGFENGVLIHIQAFFEFAPLSKNAPVQGKLRAQLRAVVERVVLDPDTAALAVYYTLPAGQVVASPSRTELTRPTLTARRILRMTRQQRRAA